MCQMSKYRRRNQLFHFMPERTEISSYIFCPYNGYLFLMLTIYLHFTWFLDIWILINSIYFCLRNLHWIQLYISLTMGINNVITGIGSWGTSVCWFLVLVPQVYLSEYYVLLFQWCKITLIVDLKEIENNNFPLNYLKKLYISAVILMTAKFYQLEFFRRVKYGLRVRPCTVGGTSYDQAWKWQSFLYVSLV